MDQFQCVQGKFRHLFQRERERMKSLSMYFFCELFLTSLSLFSFRHLQQSVAYMFKYSSLYHSSCTLIWPFDSVFYDTFSIQTNFIFLYRSILIQLYQITIFSPNIERTEISYKKCLKSTSNLVFFWTCQLTRSSANTNQFKLTNLV